MEWKLIAAGLWGCDGTSVTIRFSPHETPALYCVEWHGKEKIGFTKKDDAFARAEQFINELVEAGIDA